MMDVRRFLAIPCAGVSGKLGHLNKMYGAVCSYRCIGGYLKGSMPSTSINYNLSN
jgi:hypothetical protein